MRRTLAMVVVAIGVLVGVPAVQAAELTREEYKSRVEPICKRNLEANKRIFEGAQEEVKEGKLKVASGHFARAQTALEKTVKQLKAVPAPPADEARLAKWTSYLETESDYIGKIGAALAQGNKGKAQTLSVQLNRNSNLANNSVLPFGFNYCKLDPSRFT